MAFGKCTRSLSSSARFWCCRFIFGTASWSLFARSLGERGDRTILTNPLSLTLIAFVVTAVPAWALTKQIGKNLENLWVMAFALLIGGIVMWIVDAVFTRPRTMDVEEMTLPQAVWIGAAQILSAIFPGTSRSMSTIA